MKDLLGPEERFYRSSKLDWFITGLILLVAVTFFIRITRGNLGSYSQSNTAFIYQRNNLLEKVSLDKDKVVTILGGAMQIEARSNRVRVLNSDCPQQICVHMGWIKYSGQTIVCVPNRVLIEIKSNQPQIIDAVSY